MASEGLRGYVQLAGGLTEVTRQRATAAARALLSSGNGSGVANLLPDQVTSQVGALAEEILATGRSNRDLLLGVVRAEVDRAVSRLGLVTASQLEELRRELAAVQLRLGAIEASLGGVREPRTADNGAGGKAAAARSAAAKGSTARSAAATGSTARSAAAKGSTARSAAADSAAGKGATATEASRTAARSSARAGARSGAGA